MSPRTGRPPSNDPKTLNTRIRMSDEQIKMLDFCVSVLGVTKAEIIRQGIEVMYQKAQQIEKGVSN